MKMNAREPEGCADVLPPPVPPAPDAAFWRERFYEMVEAVRFYDRLITELQERIRQYELMDAQRCVVHG